MANQFAGKAASEIPALKPDWGKPTVRNFREGDGNSGIIEARQAPLLYPTILGEAMETSASCEARSAPLPYPTAENNRPNCLIIKALTLNLGASRFGPVIFSHSEIILKIFGSLDNRWRFMTLTGRTGPWPSTSPITASTSQPRLLHPGGSLAGLPTTRAESFQETGADENEPD